MATRGIYSFEIDKAAMLVDSAGNLEKLRQLFLDGVIINGNWGPGDPGDFDHGSWHILCHLAGGSCVLTTPVGRAWCGITHLPAADTYQASLIYFRNGAVETLPLASEEGSKVFNSGSILGYLEGSSIGHITARGVLDPPDAFNHWPRQQFDQDASSTEDGGTVWEHWSTTRDIRSSNAIGSSVLQAYLTLVSRLGGRFVAAVARGRREHQHPLHLNALVKAGVLTASEAAWDVSPTPIPLAAEVLLYESRGQETLEAINLLEAAPGVQKYFMFQRRIDRWNHTENVKRDLALRKNQ